MQTSTVLYLCLTVLLSYFFGNINFAILISKLRKSDIRESGSGNPGTMNMLRTYGATMGVLTLFLDVLKGFIPSFTAFLLFRNIYVASFSVGDLALFLSGVSATLGHIFPVTLGFKGGKGVATTLGMFIASSPIVAIVLFLLGVLYIFLFEFGSMGSMLFLSSMAIYEGLKFSAKYVVNGAVPKEVFWLYLALCVLIFLSYVITWSAHKENVLRLVKGLEHKTRLKRILAKKKPNKNKLNKI